MNCKIVRPFDLVTRFWTYKVTVNKQTFIFKGNGTMNIEVEPASSFEIKVTTPGRIYQFGSPSARFELAEGTRIIIMSKFTNWIFLVSFLLPILLVLFGWLILNSLLFMIITMIISVLFHTYFFDVKRKNFFKITTNK